jgi:hypothetical protein
MQKNNRTESTKNRKRNCYITFRVTENERVLIDKRMAQAGMKNRRAYLLKMATDGKVANVELESVKNMVRLLSNATNNINKIAKKANSTDNIYKTDLDEIRLQYELIWTQTKEILRELAEF